MDKKKKPKSRSLKNIVSENSWGSDQGTRLRPPAKTGKLVDGI